MPKKPVTLADWQALFDQIYGRRNRRRVRGEIWLHLVGRAGLLAEALRKEAATRYIAAQLCHIFGWLCAFANKEGIQLSQMVWKKYPGYCPYCRASVKCVCIGSLRKREINWGQQPPLLDDTQLTLALSDWQKMFQRIYGNVNRVVARFQVGFHLFEEIGETARVILQREETELELEIADVFAWVMGLANKLGVDLSEHLWRMFKQGCPFCHHEVCQCD